MPTYEVGGGLLCWGFGLNKLKSVVLVIPIVLGIIGFNFSDIQTLKSKKGIYYDNFKYTDNVELIKAEGTDINYNDILINVGDYYEIVFDVINDSNVDIKVTDCIYNKDDSYINYELTYSNGQRINSGDIIKKGESKRIKYYVSYDKPIVEESYEVDSSFSIGYEQVL